LYVRVAENEEEANRDWTARRAVFGGITSEANNVFNEDVTGPMGKIPALVRKCKELSGKYELDIVVLGHAGDENLHPAILTDFDNKDLYERSVKAMDEIMEAAIELGGVLSGEHGIGLEKPRFIGRALESVVIDLMKGMKALLDPNSIMNPGKIWEQ
jgi:glycolate oxidase